MIQLHYVDLDLKPGVSAGGVSRVGPIPLGAYAAVTAQVDFLRGAGGGGVPTAAVFTLKSGVPGNLASLDTSIVSGGAATVGVNASRRITDCAQVPGDLWIDLTTEESGGSPPYRGDIVVTIRTKQDEFPGRGSDRVVVAPPGATASGVTYGSAGGSGEAPGGEGAPSGGSGS